MHEETLFHSNRDYWEERANKVLSHFNYRYPDDIDIEEICWRYGIRIMPLDEPFVENFVDYESIKHLKAFSIPKNKGRRGTIFLKPKLDAIEKKLLLSEEFCHIYAHHFSQLNIHSSFLAKMENQAKRMSAYLLMPTKFLKNVFDEVIDQAITISNIADYFLVTEEFAQYRLQLEYNRKIDLVVSFKGNMGSIEWLN